jgi:SLOG-like protein
VTARHRSKTLENKNIAFSISYQREYLLSRGLGLEHLRELLVRLARPLVRKGASLCYGGGWHDAEDNFTFDLLRLISSEQEDNVFGGSDTDLIIGKMLNYCAWPHYLEITPEIEARWINSCRIIRIRQQDAGIPERRVVPDAEAKSGSDRALFNAAVTLSAMRRLTLRGMPITIPDAGSETVPPAVARIVLGGKITGYAGFLPGIFEEALLSLEANSPLYVLGGFGGAAEVLAQTLLASTDKPPQELMPEWHHEKTPAVMKLATLVSQFALPPGIRTTTNSLETLFTSIQSARSNLSTALRTGLDDSDTRELLQTRDVGRAAQLVLKGLYAQLQLKEQPG